MHSSLTNFRGSQENVNEIRNSKRDLEEFIYPFSPVRRRRTPQPPPKVEVNIEGTDNKELSSIASKKEIPAVGIKELTTKNLCKDNKGNERYRRQKMDEYHTCMDDCDDDDTFKGDGASDEYAVRTYARPTGQRKHSNTCNNVNCSHSQSGCDASISSQCSTNTFGGPRTMGKVHELYNDLQIAEGIEESASPSKSQDARDAQLKLNKWNWLLNWLDLSGDTTGKTASRRLLNNDLTKKSAPKERKVKSQQQQQQQQQQPSMQQQQRQPPKQRSQMPAQQKEDDKTKIGRKSPSSFMKSKPKLAKNEGVDIVGLAERTKPENTGAGNAAGTGAGTGTAAGTGRRTTVQKTRSCTKRRAAPRKTAAKKPCIKKKTQPKLTRKFLADIRRRYAKVIYKKK